MLTKKLSIILLFISVATALVANSYTQPSTMKVVGKKYNVAISFSIEQNNNPLVTVEPFSYKDKTVGSFKIDFGTFNPLQKRYTVKNSMTTSYLQDKSIAITIVEATLTYNETTNSPVLFLKYKPGKMPFPITITKSN